MFFVRSLVLLFVATLLSTSFVSAYSPREQEELGVRRMHRRHADAGHQPRGLFSFSSTDNLSRTDSPSSISQASSAASTSASSSASPSSGGGSRGTSHKGDATYFQPGMGACGQSNSSSDKIVAVSKHMFKQFGSGGDPNSNKLCGKKITAKYEGKSTSVTVMDQCPTCSTHDLDLSPAAFKELAPKTKGRLKNLEWSFEN